MNNCLFILIGVKPYQSLYGYKVKNSSFYVFVHYFNSMFFLIWKQLLKKEKKLQDMGRDEERVRCMERAT